MEIVHYSGKYGSEITMCVSENKYYGLPKPPLYYIASHITPLSVTENLQLVTCEYCMDIFIAREEASLESAEWSVRNALEDIQEYRDQKEQTLSMQGK